MLINLRSVVIGYIILRLKLYLFFLLVYFVIFFEVVSVSYEHPVSSVTRLHGLLTDYLSWSIPMFCLSVIRPLQHTLFTN